MSETYLDTYRVVVKYGDDAIPVVVAGGVNFPAASTAAAAHQGATRFIINEKTDTVAATYRPVARVGG